MKRQPVEARFWSKVSKTDTCWVWIARSKYQDGYGQFGVDGRSRKASRVSWEWAYGPIPEGLSVLHKCDNTACVRPDHLFLGTQQDNMKDRDAKGRQARGERQHLAVLDETDAVLIRFLAGLGNRHHRLASWFNVNKSTITRVVRGITWKHTSGRTLPSLAFRRGKESITHDGKTLLVTEWAAQLGLLAGTIYRRMRRGVTDTNLLLSKSSIQNIKPTVTTSTTKPEQAA